jgi:hypothetical protein
MIPPFIPEAYRERTFIAGGWAACPALASDMDVWILATTTQANSSDFDLKDLRAEVLAAIKVPFNTFARLREEDSDEAGEYGGVEIKIRKVCYVDRDGVKLHVMVTNAPIIEAVLANFDISTHQIAIDHKGQVILGPDYTPVYETPKVIEGRANEHTPARLAKITARYARP